MGGPGLKRRHLAQNFVSAFVVDAHVRLCTLRLPIRALSRSASKWATFSTSVRNGRTAVSRACGLNSHVRPSTLPRRGARRTLQKPLIRAAFTLPAPFPHKVSSLRCGTLRGPRKQGRFRVLHRNIPPQRTGVGAGALDPYAHSFGDVFDSHVYFFEDGLTRRSAKLAQRAFAPALASRGAYLRPRKLDE